MSVDFKTASKRTFSFPDGEKFTYEQLKLGCMQRMADATELMAKDRVSLESQLKFYKEQNERLRQEVETLTKSRNSYKGKYYSLKNKPK